MRGVRQAAGALIYGIISLLLVIGGLALAQAQGVTTGSPVSTFTPLPSSTSTPRPSPTSMAVSPTATTARPTDTVVPPTKAPTRAAPTAMKTATALATSTNRPACGAPYGWVKAYVVQPGDTLFRIARLYGVSVDALQRANCKTGTVIYVGEHLWVPYAGPAATELTIIPTFPTPTEPSPAIDTATASATEVTPDP